MRTTGDGGADSEALFGEQTNVRLGSSVRNKRTNVRTTVDAAAVRVETLSVLSEIMHHRPSRIHLPQGNNARTSGSCYVQAYKEVREDKSYKG